MMAFPVPLVTDIDRPYWEAGRDGVLRMQRCQANGHLVFPPGPRCPTCGTRDLVWTELSGQGRIWSWVVFHRAFFAGAPLPYTVLRVQLDEGPFLIANLVESGDRQPSKDAAVTVRFQAVADVWLPQFALT